MSKKESMSKKDQEIKAILPVVNAYLETQRKKVRKPSWLKLGVKVQCLGEGGGNFFEVVEIDTKHGRAAIRHSYGDCWEHFSKLYLDVYRKRHT